MVTLRNRVVTRLGIISFAHGHINAYLESIKDFADVQVVAAWDDDPERGRMQCSKYGIAFEPALDALLRAVPRPLIEYLQGRAKPLATAEDGRICIEMILGAYQAAREGRRVTLFDK